MRDLGVLVAVVLPALDLGFLAHHLHEQHHGNEHAHADGHHQIEHDGQHEGEHERGHGPLRRRATQVREVAPAGHAVGDIQQNGGDGGHGDERRIGHEEREHRDEHKRVHHAGDGRAAAGLHVGGGARDGAGGGNAAEEHRGDVADALGHQLHVGAMVTADHGVGHHTGQQRLDGGQDGDGDAVGELVAEQLQAEVGHMEGGQGAVDDVEVADSADVKAEPAHQRDAREQGHKRAGHALGHARPEEQHGQADDTHQARLPVHCGEVARQRGQLLRRFHRGGARRIGKAEKVLQLADGQRDGDARGEPGRDSEGHEADKGAQLEQAHEDEQDARDDGGGDEAFYAIGGHDAGDDGGEGRRGAGNLHTAAAEERDEEPGDDGGVEALLRRHPRGDAQRDGKRQRHHRHHDARHDVLGNLLLQLLFAGMLDDAEKDGL